MKISVIIKNYNYEKYVSDAIYSVLNQSVQPYEFIVVDDCSTDNSQSIIEKICKKNPHIRFIKNEHNLGIAGTTNKAVNLATGDYIALLASDDIYLPKFIERNIQTLQDFPEAGVICSNFSYFIDENIDEIINHPRGFNSPSTTFLKDFPLIKAMRSHRFWIPSPTVMKKDLFLKFGGYVSHFGEYTDFILYSLIGFQSGVCYIPETLCAVRNHNNQLSKNINLFQRQNSWESILNAFSCGDYKNYKMHFKRSHLLYLFGVPFFYYLLRRPRFWTFADYSLWKKLGILWRRKKVDPLLKKLSIIK